MGKAPTSCLGGALLRRNGLPKRIALTGLSLTLYSFQIKSRMKWKVAFWTSKNCMAARSYPSIVAFLAVVLWLYFSKSAFKASTGRRVGSSRNFSWTAASKHRSIWSGSGLWRSAPTVLAQTCGRGRMHNHVSQGTCVFFSLSCGRGAVRITRSVVSVAGR